MDVRLSYMICSLPRSGSSLLSDSLSSTGIAGAPDEFFHPVTIEALKREWRTPTLDEYRRALMREKTGPNGVFGVKVHWGQFSPTFDDADPRSLFPNLKLVYIHRRDHLRQAVSWVRALQTRKWASAVAPPRQRSAEFDADDIRQKLKRIEGDEARWEALFERYELAPHRVVYEQLVEAFEPTVRGVLEFLGLSLEHSQTFAAPQLERQADEVSEQWVERFLRDEGDLL